MHEKTRDFVCSCGYETASYRGLNSHMGNKNRIEREHD